MTALLRAKTNGLLAEGFGNSAWLRVVDDVDGYANGLGDRHGALYAGAQQAIIDHNVHGLAQASSESAGPTSSEYTSAVSTSER